MHLLMGSYHCSNVALCVSNHRYFTNLSPYFFDTLADYFTDVQLGVSAVTAIPV